jgi:hypothetical protein
MDEMIFCSQARLYTLRQQPGFHINRVNKQGIRENFQFFMRPLLTTAEKNRRAQYLFIQLAHNLLGISDTPEKFLLIFHNGYRA